MCHEVIKENNGMLEFIPNCYKNKKVCDQAVDSYANALTLFRVGRGQKGPYQFFPCNFYKRRNWPLKLSDF